MATEYEVIWFHKGIRCRQFYTSRRDAIIKAKAKPGAIVKFWGPGYLIYGAESF